MQRFASVIGLADQHVEAYKRLHQAVWPEVLARIAACGIRNYSIYLRRMPDGRQYLFSYCEYHGCDFAADCAAMAADPVTQRWWALCKPCHTNPLSKA